MVVVMTAVYKPHLTRRKLEGCGIRGHSLTHRSNESKKRNRNGWWLQLPVLSFHTFYHVSSLLP